MSDVGSFIVGTVAVGAGIFIGTLSFGLASPIAGALIGFGSNMIRRGLRGGPDPEGAQANVARTSASLPVLYGTQKIGVKVTETWVDPNSSDREDLIRVGVICPGSEDGTGVSALNRIWLDDELAIDPVTTGDNASMRTAGVQTFFDGRLDYLAFRGRDNQAVPTALNNISNTRYPADWENKGLAYVALRLQKDKEVFPRIPNVTVEVEGQKVYDPRDATWKFSSNPALCLLDYLTSERYGAELFYPERDGGDTSLSEIDEQSFIDAANYADELVQDGSGGTQPRFRFDGFLDTGNAIGDNVGTLLASMRGSLIYQDGKFRLVIRQQKVSVKTLTEEEIVGDWEFRRGGTKEVPNKVVAKFNGGQSGDTAEETEWPEAGDTTFLDQDGGHRQTIETNLVGVQDEVRAQQIAMVMLKEAREDTAVRITCRMSVSDLEVGDVVTVDHATPGWTGADAKDFWVAEMETKVDPEGGGEQIRMTLKEYADSAYTLDAQTAPTPPPGSNLPDPTSTGAPSGLTLTSNNSTQMTTPSGDKVPAVLATWTKPLDKGIDRIVVLERENGTVNWNTAAVVEPSDEQRAHFHPKGASEGDTWEVGVYALVGQRLLKSNVVTGTVPLSTDYAAGDASDAITPEARLRIDEVQPGQVFVDAFFQAGSAVANPDIRYRTKVDGPIQDDDFGAWTAVADIDLGTWLNREISKRKPFDTPALLVVQVEDQAPAPSPRATASIPLEPINPGPWEFGGSGRERRERAGQRGGEVPTLGAILHELRSRDGAEQTYDPVAQALRKVEYRDDADNRLIDRTGFITSSLLRSSAGPAMTRSFIQPAASVTDDLDGVPDSAAWHRTDAAYQDGSGRPTTLRDGTNLIDKAAPDLYDHTFEDADVIEDGASFGVVDVGYTDASRRPTTVRDGVNLRDIGGGDILDTAADDVSRITRKKTTGTVDLALQHLSDLGSAEEKMRVGGDSGDPASVVRQLAAHASEGLAREQAQRSGLGGQEPGGESLLGDVKSRDGSKTLVDGLAEKIGTALKYQSGSGVDALEPAETGADVTSDHAADVIFRQSAAPAHQVGRIWVDSDNGDVFRSNGTNWIFIGSEDALRLTNAPAESGAEQTAGKDLNVLAGRTADKIDYLSGVTVDSKEPAEAGAEINKASLDSFAGSVGDDGSDDNYSVDWSPGENVVDADHQIKVDYIDDTSTLLNTNTITDPATTNTDSYTATGAGGDPGAVHKIVLRLQDDATATTINRYEMSIVSEDTSGGGGGGGTQPPQ